MIKNVDFAPPHAVGDSGDFIFAINSGIISRISVNGVYRFQTKDAPTWNGNLMTSSAMVGLISSKRVVDPSNQPIVVSGETSLVIMSAHGTKLGEQSYPQEPVHRPQLIDLNQDGVIDLLVVSNDGIWLFNIRFTSGSNWLIALNGLLFLLLIISLVMNRASGFDKRSNDLYESFR